MQFMCVHPATSPSFRGGDVQLWSGRCSLRRVAGSGDFQRRLAIVSANGQVRFKTFFAQ